jgi:mono/diheme cytochrome c family protein
MDNFHWSRQKPCGEPGFLGQSLISDLPRGTQRQGFSYDRLNFLPSGVSQRTALTKYMFPTYAGHSSMEALKKTNQIKAPRMTNRVTLMKFALVALAISFMMTFGIANAQPNYLGAKTCEKCHKAEAEIWKGTKHFSSFKKIHKNKTAKKILKSIGEKRMKKSKTCATCHYTVVSTRKKLKPVSGPSCESCHGAASKWVSIHNNYGGPGVKKSQETADHKAKRRKAAADAGMIWPQEIFDVASNCMSCHGLSNPALSGKNAAAMLNNGHPLNPDFELVEYSQGSVRHRFYAPDMTKNQVMNQSEMSHLYVVGQAAALVSAASAITKTDDATYQAAQKKRIATATAILSKIPEAAALLKTPSTETGRAFVLAIKGKDLTALVEGKLPKTFK